jgi:hypothetical protein
MKSRIAIVSLALLLTPETAEALAGPMNVPPASKTCLISIRDKHRNGEKKKFNFQSQLRSQKECYELARLHRTALIPETVQSRRVSYNFAFPPRKTFVAKKIAPSKQRPNKKFLAKAPKRRSR